MTGFLNFLTKHTKSAEKRWKQ